MLTYTLCLHFAHAFIHSVAVFQCLYYHTIIICLKKIEYFQIHNMSNAACQKIPGCCNISSRILQCAIQYAFSGYSGQPNSKVIAHWQMKSHSSVSTRYFLWLVDYTNCDTCMSKRANAVTTYYDLLVSILHSTVCTLSGQLRYMLKVKRKSMRFETI